jgi:hypothetical protein
MISTVPSLPPPPPSSSPVRETNMAPAILEVHGTKIVDGGKKEVILRGAGLGGWMKCAPSSFSIAQRA